MTPLAIVGIGLVSPLGLTPAEHAFFLRAEVRPAAPGGFVDAEGAPIAAAYCPWLGARASVPDRLVSLAKGALRSAAAPLAGSALVTAGGALRTALHVVTAAPRAGLSQADRDALEAELSRAFEPARGARSTGAAGGHGVLAGAAARLAGGGCLAELIVAADSLISVDALAEWQRASSMPWEADLPRGSEAAAAIAVMLPAEAKRGGIEVLATVHRAATRDGAATDDNDVTNDGAALTELVRALPPLPGPIGASFGQHGMGSLRRREWEMASARLSGRFDPTCAPFCVESHIGSVGAAAGVAGLVMAVAVHRHATWGAPRPGDAPFLAWAISRDGTRGLAALTLGG